MFNSFRQPPPNGSRWKAAHPGAAGLDHQLWRLALLLGAIVGFAAMFQRIPALVMDFESATLATGIYLGMFLVLPIFGVRWVRRAWRTANLWQSVTGSAVNPNVLRTVSILGLIGLAAFVIANAFAAPTQVRIFHIRQAFHQYSITVDPAAGVVRISGLIGPKLAPKLNAVLSRTPTIRSIEITNANGLLNEALRTAAVIEAYPHVTVIARQTCNSTCLPILLAGARRYADWDMDLGIQPARPITDMRPVDQEKVMQEILGADQYLADKGMPEKMRLFAKGHTQGMVREPAIRLAEARVLDGVMDGLQPLPLATAKWRQVERSLQRSERAALLALMEAGRDAGASFVESHAEEIYAAFLTNDSDRLRDSLCALAPQLDALHIRPADTQDACR